MFGYYFVFRFFFYFTAINSSGEDYSRYSQIYALDRKLCILSVILIKHVEGYYAELLRLKRGKLRVTPFVSIRWRWIKFSRARSEKIDRSFLLLHLVSFFIFLFFVLYSTHEHSRIKFLIKKCLVSIICIHVCKFLFFFHGEKIIFVSQVAHLCYINTQFH